MKNQINIIVFVDTIGALSSQSLDKFTYAVDNSEFNSTGQGTASLSTICQPGQVIQWIICAIDLQTPAAINNIRFLPVNPESELFEEPDEQQYVNENPDLDVWKGIVPATMIPGVPYRYVFEVVIGEGKNTLLSIQTLSLIRN